MSQGNTPDGNRKQAEANILRHMRAILKRIDHPAAASVKPHSNQSDEPVDKKHVLAVVSQFSQLKKDTRH